MSCKTTNCICKTISLVGITGKTVYPAHLVSTYNNTQTGWYMIDPGERLVKQTNSPYFTEIIIQMSVPSSALEPASGQHHCLIHHLH